MTPEQEKQKQSCQEWESMFPMGECTLYGKENCPGACYYAIRINKLEKTSSQGRE